MVIDIAWTGESVSVAVTRAPMDLTYFPLGIGLVLLIGIFIYELVKRRRSLMNVSFKENI